jgi:hypothetical protein
MVVTYESSKKWGEVHVTISKKKRKRKKEKKEKK